MIPGELEVLRMGPRIVVAPIVHGSGDCALAVRQLMMAHAWDCLAVPLPASFQPWVEGAVCYLPAPSIVVQRSLDMRHILPSRRPPRRHASYVPIDPCQGVIAAIRTALGERLPIQFVDMETDRFYPEAAITPDPYALKKTSLARYAAAILTSLERPRHAQNRARMFHMAARLYQLQKQFRQILFVCGLSEWPFVREQFMRLMNGPGREAQVPNEGDSLDWDPSDTSHDDVATPEILQPTHETLFFLLGELPFVTSLYEQARADLSSDDNLSIDGIKELFIAARSAYRQEHGRRALTIPPARLATCLRYVRNLTLLDRRMSPDLYTLIVAAQQVVGDRFALAVAETAREYSLATPLPVASVQLGIGRGRLPEGDIFQLANRLPGPPVLWRHCELQRRPPETDKRRWQMSWNPFGQCSWPPEDKAIEDFRTHVADRAQAILGADLARSEKFTTSVKDGIDIRDTLRHWHTGDIYVKVVPPSRGRLDAVVMLFDSPADPRDYPWRASWYAEHQNESTLAFFATNFQQQLVGPGIGLANYGGAMFLFPPVMIPDIWRDERLDFTETLEERLLAAACLHSQSHHVALLSSLPPGAGWRALARRYRKKWVHVPLSRFGESTIQRLRTVHVLNGRQVRSYASNFIRRPS